MELDTNNSNNHSGGLKSSYDTDVVRLIGQHLINLGLRQTVDLLLEESGLQKLDHPLATRFQQHIMAGEWDKASSLVGDIANLIMSSTTASPQLATPTASQTNTSITKASTTTATPTKGTTVKTSPSTKGHSPTSSSAVAASPLPANNLAVVDNMGANRATKPCNVNEMKLLIAEQKFLESIEDNELIRALKCLRLEITPLTSDLNRVQFLATLLMCKSTQEVRLKANWPGKGAHSRQLLFEKIQRFIPPYIMLPPKRLSTLLSQAVQLQRQRCSLHLYTPTDNSINSSNNISNINSRTHAATNGKGGEGELEISVSGGGGEGAAPLPANHALDTAASTTEEAYFDLKQDHICSSDRFPLNSRQELDSHRTEVWFCKFSNDGKKLATGGIGGKVKIWTFDTNTRKLVEKCTLDCNSFSITCLSWSPNDMYLLACGSDDRPDLWIWNVQKEEVHNMINHSDEESTTTCSWHMSGEKFAAASIKGPFNIYDLDGNRRGNREGVRVQCLSFLHKDPNYILAADTLNRIKSYAITDMSLETDEEDILEERHPIMSFTIDRDDTYIAVNLRGQGVHLWELRTKTLLRMFTGVCQQSLTVYSSFSSPHPTFLASGSEDGKVYIYNINRDQPVAILHGHTRCVNCVAWNPVYPEYLISASDDRIVRLWAPTGTSVTPTTSC